MKKGVITKGWFRDWSNEYDLTLGKTDFHKKLLDFAVKALNVKKGERVLDVGSGTGLLSLKILEKIDCGIVCVDNSRKMTEILKSKISRLKLGEKVQCKMMDAEALNFSRCTFDKIASTVALHHIKNKSRLLGQLFSALKPGGRLVIGEIDMDTTGKHHDIERLKRILKVLEREWIAAMKYGGVKAFMRMYSNALKHIFNDGEYCISLFQWAELCKKAGFKQVSVKRVQGYRHFGIVTAEK